MSVLVYLVRHGESVWNGQQRIQGQADPALSARGHRQARAVARRLRAIPLDRLLASPLRRARQTAEMIARSTHRRIETVPAFAEIALGAWEGLTPATVDRRYRGGYRRWLAAPSATRVPGAEAIPAFRRRVLRAFHRLIAESDGARHLCLVTHGGVITAILAEAWRADFDRLLIRLRLDNTGLTVVEATARWRYVTAVNDTAHLRAAGAVVGPAPFPKPHHVSERLSA